MAIVLREPRGSPRCGRVIGPCTAIPRMTTTVHAKAIGNGKGIEFAPRYGVPTHREWSTNSHLHLVLPVALAFEFSRRGTYGEFAGRHKDHFRTLRTVFKRTTV